MGECSKQEFLDWREEGTEITHTAQANIDAAALMERAAHMR